MPAKTSLDADEGRGDLSNILSQPHGDVLLQRQSSIVDELELAGMTIFEKKCRLINNEIDAMGMGRYQWYLWSLCGFGYLLDLLWAQAFNLILTPLEQELGIPGISVDMRNRLHANIRVSKSRWKHLNRIRCGLDDWRGILGCCS